MRNISLLGYTFFTAAILSCKKNPTSQGPPVVKPACKIISFSTTLPGNQSTTVFTYTNDTILTRMQRFVGNNVLQTDKTISTVGNGILGWSAFTNPNKASIEYFTNGSQPEYAERYLNDGNNLYLGGYDFHYDGKGRLVKVVQGTPQPNDYEYTLEIVYNDKDNVVRLEYETTTGPAGELTIFVSGYDDHPTPYSAIPYWKFAMDALWDNYDPEPIITALSKNNPLDYTSGTYHREMVYTYNEQGFPVSRKITNTNTNPVNSVTYTEAFAYSCN